MILVRLSYHSEYLGRQTSVTLLIPKKKIEGGYSYLVLLHPKGGDHTVISRMTSIERYLEEGDLMVAMPDGGTGDYLNDPYLPYEDIMGEELNKKLEHFFCVSKDPNRRYIGGLGEGAKAAEEIYREHMEDYAGFISVLPEGGTWRDYDLALEKKMRQLVYGG